VRGKKAPSAIPSESEGGPVASMWRQAMLYLGLGPDEDYDDLNSQQVNGQFASAEVERGEGAVTVVTSPRNNISDDSTTDYDDGQRSNLPASGITATGSVRTIPISSAKPHVIAPRSFNEAQQVADRFKADQPVIINLQAADRDLARRLIDFTSGLCYALNGNMEKVADQVYLLAPSNVSLAEEERQRLQERGLHY
jgi:cell division inhibitor SepF